MTPEERTLILGALFHDIGKFEQRCTGNPARRKHPELGVNLVDDGRFLYRFEKIVGKENIPTFKNIISEHHNPKAIGLTPIVREADRLSASERVDKEEVEVYQDQWNHKHLSSLFSKINILSEDEIAPRYYKHNHLSRKEYDVIIPTETNESDIKEYSYKESDWNLFREDLEYVLDVYDNEDDFASLINLLLILFEKYMWCIPDFTGSSKTDISLYNHLKDVAGFAHAIYLTQKENSNKLCLIIGDLPGIQQYIFNVVNRKPAKILRGRSIYVQVLTRNITTKYLNSLGLTDVNLIMLAGGKFYIIAPHTEKMKNTFYETKDKIEDFLFDKFRMELGFNAAYHPFDYSRLMDKEAATNFGQIVEYASHKLIENRYYLFNNRLMQDGNIEYDRYILDEKYIEGDESGTDSVKCRVTDKPIRRDRLNKDTVPEEDGYLEVDEQVAIEYKIGDKITKNDFIIAIDKDDFLKIYSNESVSVDDYDDNTKNRMKLLLNPTFEKLKEKQNKYKDFFRNTYYLDVANYCSESFDEKMKTVMPFDKMVEYNNGAKYLALIKGDIDNLGLIMAYGLSSDMEDLRAVSRTTTFSNHLKYYFSFFLNGFLEEWEKKNSENKVYTIFAGGDDVMLVAPQSSAVRLIKAFNDKFEEFTCENKEIHISYSVTHFKDHTPIRIVADIAELNQNYCKEYTKAHHRNLLNTNNKNAFIAANDKAGTLLFNTFIKNDTLEYFLKKVDHLTMMANNEKSGFSHGLIRRLFDLSEMLKKYEETQDAAYLIGYARLNHTVNRVLKDTDGETRKFFDHILTINKEGNSEAQLIEKILHPLVCQLIYNVRR